jgi:hypothetical protein
MICSSVSRFFMSNLLVVVDWTLKSSATQFQGDVGGTSLLAPQPPSSFRANRDQAATARCLVLPICSATCCVPVKASGHFYEIAREFALAIHAIRRLCEYTIKHFWHMPSANVVEATARCVIFGITNAWNPSPCHLVGINIVKLPGSDNRNIYRNSRNRG